MARCLCDRKVGFTNSTLNAFLSTPRRNIVSPIYFPYMHIVIVTLFLRLCLAVTVRHPLAVIPQLTNFKRQSRPWEARVAQLVKFLSFYPKAHYRVHKMP
jgi:hypothetical protein